MIAFSLRAGLAATGLAVLTGCTAMNPVNQECVDPDGRLAQALALGKPEPTADGGLCLADGRDLVGCEAIRQRVNQLVTFCPRHAPTVLAAAMLAYDAGSIAVAQQYLDDLLAWTRTYPEAFVLRCRIAVQEGNLRLARRLVDEGIQQVPNNPGLREMQASVTYLQRQYPEAREALEIAGRLGAPAWRVSFNLGLVEEAQGNTEAAAWRYTEALDARPDFMPARARLDAIRAGAAPRLPGP